MDEEGRITSPDGTRIAYRLSARGSDRCVVLVHGFFASKDTPTFRRIAADVDPSLDVLAVDLRGHGRSSGRFTFSAKEPDDLAAVLRFARPRYRRVGLFGFSYGGAISIVAQAETRLGDSLACVCAPMRHRDVRIKWWTPAFWALSPNAFERGAGIRPGNPLLPKPRPVDRVGEIGVPVLFLQGSRDPMVGERHARGLYEHAREPKEIFVFEGGSHAQNIYRQSPAEFMRRANGWFLKTL